MSEQFDLVFVVPFDSSMFVDPSVLGSEWTVSAGSGFYLYLPRTPEGEQAPKGALREPPAVTGITSKFLEQGWGACYQNGTHLVAEIHALCAVVPCQGVLDIDLPRTQVDAPEIDELRRSVSRWCDAFTHWCWVLTAQSLDSRQPDPKQIHRRSRNIWQCVRRGSERSVAYVGSPGLVAELGPDSPTSERVVDERVLKQAIERSVIGQPGMSLELLAVARIAGRRGDRRRAIADAGTAAESALTKRLQLPVDHGKGLGELVTNATNHGIGLPADVRSALVQPRNDAVHRGISPSHQALDRALEICEELVASVEPDCIRSASLRAVHRPQRHDLLIIRPPTPPAAEGLK